MIIYIGYNFKSQMNTDSHDYYAINALQEKNGWQKI